MATAARNVEPRRTTIALPSGLGDNKRALLSDSAIATVQLVEMVPSEEGGERPVCTDLGELPLGTRELYTQYRQNGDFYCFIHGKRQVSAIGDTLVEAFGNALAKAA